VDWLVCDIVLQPIRIAALVGDWIAEGLARRAIVNLKLPMKRRYAEVERCLDLLRSRLRETGVTADLTVRQLYHDREEVTLYVTRRD
jgi:23S rRNA (cytidine2498-2'-O)-methyltransferase